jgi:uncharacterized protein
MKLHGYAPRLTPLVTIIVDAEERIRAFLPQSHGLLGESLATFDQVEVIRCTGPASDRLPTERRR